MIDIDKLARESGASLDDNEWTGEVDWWRFSPDELQLFAEKVMLASQETERERAKALVEALKEAIDSGIVPISSASEGGANKYSRQVLAADRIRAAIAKYEGEK
jgi:hypothetical protein